MDKHIIPALLDKYFEGLSSLEEEQQLKQFFAQPDLPADLAVYQPLFQWQAAEKARRLPDDFDEQLLAIIAEQDRQPLFRRIMIHPLSRVAAVAVLSIGLWWAYQTDVSNTSKATSSINWAQYEPKTPEEALTITRNAMIMISKELNKGTSRVAKEVVKVRQLGKVN